MSPEEEFEALVIERPRRKGASENTKPTYGFFYYPEFKQITGSINAALMLSQAYRWHCIVKANGGQFFYKTEDEWDYETGLTRKQQEDARKRLMLCGIVTEKLAGNHPRRIYLCVHMDVVNRRLKAYREGRLKRTKTVDIKKLQLTAVRRDTNRECRKGAVPECP